jgi:hypothetical protein
LLLFIQCSSKKNNIELTQITTEVIIKEQANPSILTKRRGKNIVIPLFGCGGCTASVMKLLAADSSLQIGCIITGFSSLKEVRLKFGANFCKRCNLDTLDTYRALISEDPNFPWLFSFANDSTLTSKTVLNANNIEVELEKLYSEIVLK